MSYIDFCEELKYHDIIIKVEQIDESISPFNTVIATKTFYFCRAILCAKNEKFAATIRCYEYFPSTFDKLTIIEKITSAPALFNKILNHIWGNQILYGSSDEVVDLYMLADYFIIPYLKDKISEAILMGRMNYNHDQLSLICFKLKDMDDRFNKKFNEMVVSSLPKIPKTTPSAIIEYILSMNDIKMAIFLLIGLINQDKTMSIHGSNILTRLDEYGYKKYIHECTKRSEIIELAKIIRLVNPSDKEKYFGPIFTEISMFVTIDKHRGDKKV